MPLWNDTTAPVSPAEINGGNQFAAGQGIVWSDMVKLFENTLKTKRIVDNLTFVFDTEESLPTTKTVDGNGNITFTFPGLQKHCFIAPSTVMPSAATKSDWKVPSESLLYDQIPYDKVIRTQEEFEDLLDSETWDGAESVALVGQFTLSTPDNIGIKIPATVKQIHGFNSAKITITNFLYNSTSAKGGLWYDTRPTTNEYEIHNLEVDCTGVYGAGFRNCANLTNCTGTGTGTTSGSGFDNCTNLTNCIGTGTGTSNGYGFNTISYATNCKDGGSSTAMWGGTNKNINLETCRKTLVDADNSTLNA